MNGATGTHDTVSPRSMLDQIGRIGDQEEAVWEVGGPPLLEADLGEIAEAHRSTLLRDLPRGDIGRSARRPHRPGR
jgi:hypothetical protein